VFVGDINFFADLVGDDPVVGTKGVDIVNEVFWEAV
jgi:hypothetical protein